MNFCCSFPIHLFVCFWCVHPSLCFLVIDSEIFYIYVDTCLCVWKVKECNHTWTDIVTSHYPSPWPIQFLKRIIYYFLSTGLIHSPKIICCPLDGCLLHLPSPL